MKFRELNWPTIGVIVGAVLLWVPICFFLAKIGVLGKILPLLELLTGCKLH